MKRFLRILAMAAWWGSVQWAQVAGPKVALTWRDSFPMRWFPEARRLELEGFDRKGNLAQKHVDLPEGYRYALGWGEIWRIDARASQAEISRSRDGLTWTREGTFVGAELPFHWVPLGPDRLVATGWKQPLVEGDQASPVGIFRRNEQGEYRLEKVIQLMKEPLYLKTTRPHAQGESPAEAIFVENPKYGHFFLHNIVLQVIPFRALPQGALFVSPWGGQVWLINEAGDLQRTYRVFARPKEGDWRDILMFVLTLLGLQITSKGHGLLASRSQDAVLEARKAHPVVIRREGRLQPSGDAHQSHLNQQDAGFMFPSILWWDLDPEKGSLDRLETPVPGSPEQLPGSPEQTQAWIQSFNFVLGRSGVLRMITP